MDITCAILDWAAKNNLNVLYRRKILLSFTVQSLTWLLKSFIINLSAVIITQYQNIIIENVKSVEQCKGGVSLSHLHLSSHALHIIVLIDVTVSRTPQSLPPCGVTALPGANRGFFSAASSNECLSNSCSGRPANPCINLGCRWYRRAVVILRWSA